MNCILLSYKNWVIKIYNYSSMELLSFNWLCKHIKKIRSSYDFVRTDSCTEFSVSHWVSVLALKKQTQHLFKLGPPPIIVLKKPLFQKKRKSYKTCSNFVLVSLRQNWLLRPWKLCFSDFHLLITFVQKLTFLLNVPMVAYSNLWHRKWLLICVLVPPIQHQQTVISETHIIPGCMMYTYQIKELSNHE